MSDNVNKGYKFDMNEFSLRLFLVMASTCLNI